MNAQERRAASGRGQAGPRSPPPQLLDIFLNFKDEGMGSPLSPCLSGPESISLSADPPGGLWFSLAGAMPV